MSTNLYLFRCIPVKLQWANVDKSVHSQEYGVLEEDGRDLYQAIHAKANDTANVAWVKLNAGQDGFYRVLYPARLQDKLAGHIADVPINDRLGLLMDAFALGRTGRLPIGQLMSTLSKFQGDRSFPVWSEITQSLEGMYRLFSSRPEIATPMRTFIIELLAPVKEWLEAAISTAPKDQLDSLNVNFAFCIKTNSEFSYFPIFFILAILLANPQLPRCSQ